MTGGDGAIRVEPAVLEQLAARFSSVAAGTGSVRGSVSGAASAADGCAGPAASSFARLQVLLGLALGGLDSGSAALSRATLSAATAYFDTDGAVFLPSAPGCPAVP